MEQIKAVQLDLARQKETLNQVFSFFRMAADYKYNTIVLYLEDKIKTDSYPYNLDEESYLPEEITQMVNFASELGLELIPAVSNFAHTDGFLAHEELRELSELRGNIKGRFTEAGHAIYVAACPLFEKSQKFFDTYYAEIASLFPSKYFLAGLDEDFDIGHCDLCRREVEKHGGIGRLFLQHVTRTHSVLKALGKEMMMFDDMFWFCPEILPEVPRDIIMCTWNYEYVDRFPRCQFGNNKQADIFATYDKLGIRYIMTVWANLIHSVDTFTKYAQTRSPMGFLNTTWQMTAEPILFTYPLVAYTGMLWNGELTEAPLERMKKAIAELCGITDPSELAVLSEAASKPYLLRVPTYYLHDVIVRRNANFDDEYRDIAYNCELLEKIESSNEIVEQIKYRAKRAKLMCEQFIVAQDVFDMRTGIRKINLDRCVEALVSIRDEISDMYAFQRTVWQRLRAGIPSNFLDEEERKDLEAADKLIDIARNASYAQNGVLDMVMFLPDKSTASKIEVTLRYEDGEEICGKDMFKPIISACYNISDKGPYIYTVSFVTDKSRIPQSCRISVRGFGASYISYVSVFSDSVRYVPSQVKAVCGHVENTSHLMVYDTRWCTIGNSEMIKSMNSYNVSDEVSAVDISLMPECETEACLWQK